MTATLAPTHEGIDAATLDVETHGWTVRQWLELDATRLQRTTQWLNAWWVSLAWRRIVIGAENMPVDGGVLSCPNHTHWVDAWIQALGHTRRPIRYMGKSTLITNRWIGGYLRRGGVFPVVRGATDTTAINLAELTLRDGQMLVMYPEGTRNRTHGGGMGRSRSGAARLALATGCTIVPSATWGLQPGTGRDHIPRWMRPLPLRRTLTVTAFGEPFSVPEEHDPTRERVVEVRDEIFRRIGEQLDRARSVAIERGGRPS